MNAANLCLEAVYRTYSKISKNKVFVFRLCQVKERVIKSQKKELSFCALKLYTAYCIARTLNLSLYKR